MGFNKKYTFVNPYTFIPVDFSQIETKNIEEEPGTYTGVLKCRLITKTPLAVPDPTSVVKDEKEHPTYKFMRFENDKTDSNTDVFIPGSTIRGPIRSVYETLTDSCYSTADPSDTITYRNAGNGFEPGILKKTSDGKYQLYKAKRYIFKVNGTSYRPFDKCPNIYCVEEKNLKNFKYGQEVFFSECSDNGGSYKKRGKTVGYYIGNIVTEKANSQEPNTGYICIGEPFENVKHFESVFAFDEVSTNDENSKEYINIKENENTPDNLADAIGTLDEIIKLYNDDKLNRKLKKNKKVYTGRKYSSMTESDCFPIWYRVNKIEQNKGNQKADFTYIDLSVAELGRAAYGKNMGKLLNKKVPCKSRDKACPACRLFGMAGEKYLGSKVRFSDALPADNNKLKFENVVLKELAGPKTSYLPFYSRVKNEDGKLTRNDWSYNKDEVELRGRKYYWHNLDKNAYRAPNKEKTKRNSTMELAGTGAEFVFYVYFDNVTKAELFQLEWTITLGGNSTDDEHWHKIGHGKPIGLGSVKMVIEEERIRCFSENGYEVKTRDKIEVSDPFKDNSIVQNVLKVTSSKTNSSCTISYPYVAPKDGTPFLNSPNNKTAAHQWFSNNFKLGDKKPTFVLPEVGADSQALQAFQPDNVKENSNRDSGDGKSKSNIDRKSKDETITVKILRIFENSKKSGSYIGIFDGGKVFDIPKKIAPKSKIKVEVTYTKDNKKRYKYKGEA